MGTLILGVIHRFNLIPLNLPGFLLILLVIYYALLQLFKTNNLNSFLFGSAGRGGGFISLVSFTIIFLIISKSKSDLKIYFINTYLITLVIALVFGILQFTNIIPWESSINFEALTLTLDNPNFASAYLGVATFVLIIFISGKKQMFNWIYLILLGLALFELYKTRSIQGGFVLVLMLSIYFWQKYKLKFLKTTRKVLIAFGLVGVLAALISSDWFIKKASVEQRLSYWDLAVDIIRDNLIFGIGLDNLSRYSPKYRNVSLTNQEGVFTVLDRSHNVIIDHFVFGGLIGGTLWLGFTSLITLKVIENFKKIQLGSLTSYDLVVNFMWFGYLIQSLISPDHISLTLMGFISAALIMNDNLKSMLKFDMKRLK